MQQCRTREQGRCNNACFKSTPRALMYLFFGYDLFSARDQNVLPRGSGYLIVPELEVKDHILAFGA